MDPTQQTVVRSGSPFEVLALAEGTLGFTPRESLLLVSLRPPRWRTGLVARVDLPGPAHAAEVARMMAGHIADDGAGRCFVAVVTDAGAVPRPRRAERRAGGQGGRRWQLPRTVLAEQVARALTDLDVDPEPWLVHRGRLYSYSCRGPCCPAEGLSMERLGSTQVAAELVLDGRVLGLDRQQRDAALRAEVAPVAEETLAAVDRALAQVEARRRRGADPVAVAAMEAWRGLVVVTRPPDPGVLAERLVPATAAVLLDALARVPLRDHLLGVLVPEALGPEGMPPYLAPTGEDGSGEDGSGEDGTGEPDVGTAVQVLQLLAQRARPGRRAAPLGCAAYLQWSCGAAPSGGRLAEMALADDPGHTLSGLVLRSVELGLGPSPVTQRRASDG